MKEATDYKFERFNFGHINGLDILYCTPSSQEYRKYPISPLKYLLEEYQGRPNISSLILHLADKNWVSISLLNDLVNEINTIYPDNSIDWEASLNYAKKIKGDSEG